MNTHRSEPLPSHPQPALETLCPVHRPRGVLASLQRVFSQAQRCVLLQTGKALSGGVACLQAQTSGDKTQTKMVLWLSTWEGSSRNKGDPRSQGSLPRGGTTQHGRSVAGELGSSNKVYGSPQVATHPERAVHRGDLFYVRT